MKEIAPYTKNFEFTCDECGFQMEVEASPESCPACGSPGMKMSLECRQPLLDFLHNTLFIPVPGHDCRMAKLPVPQIVWRLVMGPLATPFLGDLLPVASVSWNDCALFISRLNAFDGVCASGRVFRMPTTAEWKAAALRGRRKFDNLAWFWNNSGSVPHPVGGKGANPLGFCDLFGNVWEWCADGNDSGRACLGGCWCSDEEGCFEVETWPEATRSSFIGFRLCAEKRS